MYMTLCDLKVLRVMSLRNHTQKLPSEYRKKMCFVLSIIRVWNLDEFAQEIECRLHVSRAATKCLQILNTLTAWTACQRSTT